MIDLDATLTDGAATAQPPEGLEALLDRLLTDEYGYDEWSELRSLRRIVSAIEASPWLAARVQDAREQGRREARSGPPEAAHRRAAAIPVSPSPGPV